MVSVTERRKRPRRRTITQILDIMQEKADIHYFGDLHNNGLEIFKTLEEGDQKTFLRQSLMLHWERQIERARVHLEDVVIDDDIRIDPVAVEKERMSIEDLNQAELIKMRTWLHKFLAIVGTTLFCGMLLIFYFTDVKSGKSDDMFEILNNVMQLITG